MSPSWEAISALAAVISALVVVATVVVGLRQVSVAGEQVEHLRRATQLEGTMKIFDELTGPDMRAATLFVLHELEGRMTDPTFRAEVSLTGQAPVERHPELTVLRTYEKIGTFVKHHLLERTLIFDYVAPPLMSTWERLERCGLIAIHREKIPQLWENYELLYRDCRRWIAALDAPSGGPKS